MSRFAWKPSPAMVVACVALVVAMAGTSIAAVQIGKGDVGAKELGKVTLRTDKELVESVNEDNHGDVKAKCKSGEQLLGGGALFANASADEYADVNFSGPDGKNAWRAGGYVNGEEAPDDFTLVATAICLAK